MFSYHAFRFIIRQTDGHVTIAMEKTHIVFIVEDKVMLKVNAKRNPYLSAVT